MADRRKPFPIRLAVFDCRRGNDEGGNDDKVLAFYPPQTLPLDQSNLTGLLHGLLLFASNFKVGADPWHGHDLIPAGCLSRPRRTPWAAEQLYCLIHTPRDRPQGFPTPSLLGAEQGHNRSVTETDKAISVLWQAEPSIWFALVSCLVACCLLLAYEP